MKQLKILYFTTDKSNYTWKSDHYFKLELQKLPDVHVHFMETMGHVPDILKELDFKPDFIYLDDFMEIGVRNGLPTGLEQVNIPKGVLFHDIHRSRRNFVKFVKENNIDLLFSHYRDSFLKFYPQFTDKLRWLPLHIYPSIYKDYNLEKTIDFLLMGRLRRIWYPFRLQIYQKMSKIKGFVSHDHPGYKNFKKNNEQKVLLDEEYAMEINKAKMFLTCGSKFNYPLGKYFEIPACGTLLVAVGFPELKDLGFIDGKTFVEINGDNIVEKALYYSKHEDKRKEITKNGYRLIHTRHTTAVRVREFVDELWKYTQMNN